MSLNSVRAAAVCLLFCGSLPVVRAAEATLTVDAGHPGIRVSPRLYGIFFEEISRAGDGGLYAEMLENRSFEDFNQPVGWNVLAGGATMALDQSRPLNDRNPTSLRLEIPRLAPGARGGVYSQGFKGSLVADAHDPVFTLAQADQDKAAAPYAKWLESVAQAQSRPANGLNIEAGKVYHLSVCARADAAFTGPLTASLEKQDGTVLAAREFRGLTGAWNRLAVDFQPSAGDANARLVLSARTPGTIWLDMVSLFPAATYLGRPNGLHADLMQMLAALHPAFVRFPGGSYGEGYTLKGAYRWKETVGDIAQRPGHWNIWGYRSSDGLGFHELLQMCEDLKAEPLYVPNCGIAEKEMVAPDQEEPWIQDALDAIAYANGNGTSTWGALRARNGHPAPFGLRLLEIGNENGMGYFWGGGNAEQYAQRYVPFYKRVKAADPDILTIATAPIQKPPNNAPVEVVDEHYYPTAEWFEEHANQYDGYDRHGPKIYVGEYATKPGAGHGNLGAALGEAAFMTGMERNSDLVIMSSYAPLLVNPNWDSWEPDAIVFDSAHAYGTPSYYNQLLFSTNRPDVILPLTWQTPPKTLYAVAGRQDQTGDLILKVVNIGGEPQNTTIGLTGAGLGARSLHAQVLTSASPNDENSFAAPTRIVPRVQDLGAVSANFPFTFTPYSITVLRLK